MRIAFVFFFSSRRRHTRCSRDWSSDVCSSDLLVRIGVLARYARGACRGVPRLPGAALQGRSLGEDGLAGELPARVHELWPWVRAALHDADVPGGASPVARNGPRASRDRVLCGWFQLGGRLADLAGGGGVAEGVPASRPAAGRPGVALGVEGGYATPP